MSNRFVRGFAALSTSALIAVFASSAAAQPAPVPLRLIQGSDGTLYVVQGSNSWTAVPDQASDSDVAALNPRGEIDGTFPNELFLVQAPAPPPVAAPAPTPQPAQPSPALSPLEGKWVGTLVQDSGDRYAISINLHMDGINASGTFRGETTAGGPFVTRNFVGTFRDGTLHTKGTTQVDATSGVNWCPPDSWEHVLTLSGNQLDGLEIGCGPGKLHLTKS